MRAQTDVRTTTAFDGKYLGLTTFKRDGRGVTTPVWFVPEDGRLLVETDADSYKVKRIRREPTVMVGLCSARGQMRELPVTAQRESSCPTTRSPWSRHRWRASTGWACSSSSRSA